VCRNLDSLVHWTQATVQGWVRISCSNQNSTASIFGRAQHTHIHARARPTIAITEFCHVKMRTLGWVVSNKSGSESESRNFLKAILCLYHRYCDSCSRPRIKYENTRRKFELSGCFLFVRGTFEKFCNLRMPVMWNSLFFNNQQSPRSSIHLWHFSTERFMPLKYKKAVLLQGNRARCRSCSFWFNVRRRSLKACFHYGCAVRCER